MFNSRFDSKPYDSQNLHPESSHQPRVLTHAEILEYLENPQGFSPLEIQILTILSKRNEFPSTQPKRVLLAEAAKYLEAAKAQGTNLIQYANQDPRVQNISLTVREILHTPPEPPQNLTQQLNNKLDESKLPATHDEALYKKVVTLAPGEERSAVLASSRMLSSYEVRSYLHHHEGFTPNDLDFLNFLNDMDKNPSIYKKAQIISKIESYITESSKEHTDTKIADLDPRIVRLRKTALLLYKFSIIPEQNVASGSYKKARFPIGVDPELTNDYLQNILREIGPIWAWKGELPTALSEPHRSRRSRNIKQLVQITATSGAVENHLNNEREKLAKAIATASTASEMLRLAQKTLAIPIITPDILKEIDLIEAMRIQLGDPSYLPNFRESARNRKTSTSLHPEYLPKPQKSETTKEVVNTALQLLTALEEIWRITGKINTDLKVDNIRKTTQKEPVIFDWGGFLELAPGQETMIVPEDIIATPLYLWPETLESVEQKQEISVEKLIVFDIAKLLLCDLYGIRSVAYALNKDNGHRINDYLYTINQETYAYLKKHDSTVFTVSPELDQLLERMLADKPEDRPAIAEVKEKLSAIFENTPEETVFNF